jgi:hypothetical protein
MKSMSIRVGLGLTLACVIGVLSGCAGEPPVRVTGKPSHATFKIEFQPDRVTPPTGMIITPDDGDVFLRVVRSPGPDDNKVVWQSEQNFRIRFVQIDDQTQPLRPGKELGNEKKDWNEASQRNGVWNYTLNLRQGSGNGKEVVGAKYLVEHADSSTVFDPVIIVER